MADAARENTGAAKVVLRRGAHSRTVWRNAASGQFLTKAYAYETPRKKRRIEMRDVQTAARLKAAAAQADAGHGIDTTGMSDEEFIALLRR